VNSESLDFSENMGNSENAEDSDSIRQSVLVFASEKLNESQSEVPSLDFEETLPFSSSSVLVLTGIVLETFSFDETHDSRIPNV
jgi:hypothetical protein